MKFVQPEKHERVHVGVVRGKILLHSQKTGYFIDFYSVFILSLLYLYFQGISSQTPGPPVAPIRCTVREL